MPRIRSLKPELPQDVALASVSRGARYTFVLVLTQCDDAGYFRANRRILLGQLYPHDLDISESQLSEELDELAPFIEIRDAVDGPIGRVRNWKKHQKIDRPTKSFLEPLFAAAPPQTREGLANESRTAREPIARVQRTGVLSPESRVLSPDLKIPRAKKARSGGPSFALAPYIDVHREFFPDSDPPAARYGKIFKRLEGKHGAPETLRRWRNCLTRKTTFATPEMLSAHWSEYADASPADPLEHRVGSLLADQAQRELDDAAWLESRRNGTPPANGAHP